MDELQVAITAEIRKMLYPSPLMHWMEGLAQAERVGRIKRSKFSVLRYGIRQFLVTSIATGVPESEDYKVIIEPWDDEVIIQASTNTQARQWEVAYPDWLVDFLDEEENFWLMTRRCEEKLEEVLQRIYEWCMAHPPYDILVTKS